MTLEEWWARSIALILTIAWSLGPVEGNPKQLRPNARLHDEVVVKQHDMNKYTVVLALLCAIFIISFLAGILVCMLCFKSKKGDIEAQAETQELVQIATTDARTDDKEELDKTDEEKDGWKEAENNMYSDNGSGQPILFLSNCPVH